MENRTTLEEQMHGLMGYETATGTYTNGVVRERPLVSPDEQADCNMVELLYDSRARSAWHVYPGAKIIMVTEGEGYFQEEGAAVKKIHFGDVVKIAPGVRHWQGATPNGRLMHITISLNVLGNAIQWLGPVQT